jgi:hypothetical protein
MNECRRCGKQVVVNSLYGEVLEGMHWVCFHLEYEHGDHDPDEPCNDPDCFWHRDSGKLKTKPA